MDRTRFDGITKLFAARRTRRAMLQGGAGLAASAGVGGFTASEANAQEASPAAIPIATDGDYEKTMYLFVQTFQSGSLTPNADGETLTLTLEQGLGQTIYFGDRPSRDVGVSPTETFLEGLGFSEENPPNAALLVDAGAGETDLAVLELFEPTYDASTHTAIYQVKGLEAWEDTLQLGLQDSPSDLSGMAPEFGAAHLLIDDCAAGPVGCYYVNGDGGWGTHLGTFYEQAMCYNYLVCMPCEPYGHTQPDRCTTYAYWAQKCADTYGDECGPQGCRAFFDSADIVGCTGGTLPNS